MLTREASFPMLHRDGGVVPEGAPIPNRGPAQVGDASPIIAYQSTRSQSERYPPLRAGRPKGRLPVYDIPSS